jgi:NAD(P)-dependent dehydrogenase (short-subunit alcohol dehydrogenase family)
MRLKDKVAIVTGVEAGSIGQATALILAEAGVTVAVIGGGEQDGNETVALIRKGGRDALLLNLDIAKERDAKQACEDTVRAFGRLDIPGEQRRCLWLEDWSRLSRTGKTPL